MTYRFSKIGTDTEIFLRGPDGQPFPVCGLLGGTKQKPRAVLTAIKNGFAVQEDNVMAEFNIPPCTSIGQWYDYLDHIRNYLTVFFEGAGNFTLHPQASMRFLPEQLQSEQAKTFGCDPDFSIWKLEENIIDKKNPELATLRTAGGHIHVSFTVDGRDPEPAELIHVVKLLDLFLGVPSILMDKDNLRRGIYGRAGAFRPKPYGVEYRVLSSKWFANSQNWKWVFESLQRVFGMLRQSPEKLEGHFEKHGQMIQDTINNSIVENVSLLAREFDFCYPYSDEDLEGGKKDKEKVPRTISSLDPQPVTFTDSMATGVFSMAGDPIGEAQQVGSWAESINNAVATAVAQERNPTESELDAYARFIARRVTNE